MPSSSQLDSVELFTDVEEEEEAEEGMTDGSGPTHGDYDNVLCVTVEMGNQLTSNHAQIWQLDNKLTPDHI